MACPPANSTSSVSTATLHGLSTPPSRSNDSSVLFAVSEDGSLSVHDVRDVQAMHQADRERDVLPWAEEVLVTKSDLEEKRRQMAELEARLQDNQVGFDYEKRAKESQMNERVKELTARFTDELERNKEAFERLLQDKNELEMRYEERIRTADEQHQHRCAALDNKFQQKIMVRRAPAGQRSRPGPLARRRRSEPRRHQCR